MVERQLLLLEEPEDYLKIVVYLDENNFVLCWGTALESTEGERVELVLHKSHPLLNQLNFMEFQYQDGNLVLVESRQLNTYRQVQLSTLKEECRQAILDGFEYTYQDVVYHASYSDLKQRSFEEYSRLFMIGATSSVSWEFLLDGKEVLVELDKLEFLTFSAYASQIKQDKMSKLTKELTTLVNEASTIEEIKAIHWESVSDYPAPEKPIIDLEGESIAKVNEKQSALQKNIDELQDMLFALLG